MKDKTVLGYCLWVLFEDDDLEVSKFFEVFDALQDNLFKEEYNNLDVLNLFVDSLSQCGYEREKYRELASDLHYKFDMHTEEEAEEWYDKHILQK